MGPAFTAPERRAILKEPGHGRKQVSSLEFLPQIHPLCRPWARGQTTELHSPASPELTIVNRQTALDGVASGFTAPDHEATTVNHANRYSNLETLTRRIDCPHDYACLGEQPVCGTAKYTSRDVDVLLCQCSAPCPSC